MIEPNSSWVCQRHSAWQRHNFNYLTVNASAGQLEPMTAYVKPHDVSAYVAPNGYNVSGLPVEKGVKIKDEGHFVQNHPSPNIEASLSTMNPYPNENKFCLSTGYVRKATAHETSYSQQKKFLIFDRSGEETRVILSTLCPPMCNQAAGTAKPLSTNKSWEKLHAFKPEKSCPKVPDLSEDSDEDHVTGEGNDYHDDTEEINALLYSSSDELGKDEDEISTGRSPSAIDTGFENLDEGEDFEEVNSLALSSKRQKLLEGGSCTKLSSVETIAANSTPRSFEDESVVNLNSSIGEQAFLNAGCKRMRMHKFHDKLRILQKFIPSSKTKDPLVIMDEAIGYVKSLKAESLYRKKAEGPS